MGTSENPGCAAVWNAANRSDKAKALDAYSPGCGCQTHSLRDPPGLPVHDDELIVRVLTSPDSYDTSAEEVLTRKFTALFSSGVSVIRQGASESEIRRTVEELTNTADPNSLIGCVLIRAALIRSLDPPGKAFCIYDTEDGGKTHHADIVCCMPNESSKNQNERKKEACRYALRNLMRAHVRKVSSIEQLIDLVREAERETAK